MSVKWRYERGVHTAYEAIFRISRRCLAFGPDLNLPPQPAAFASDVDECPSWGRISNRSPAAGVASGKISDLCPVGHEPIEASQWLRHDFPRVSRRILSLFGSNRLLETNCRGLKMAVFRRFRRT